MTFDINQATPMMQQWHQCKLKAKEALLLFRMGDFYEAFYEDAITLAKALDLTLTKRQEIPMSGIPYHAFNNYIDRLLAFGYHVAIAEQTEDPKEAKGLVKRDLVRVITPGTLIDSNLLDAGSNNYILSLFHHKDEFAIAALDITTADFRVFETKNQTELFEEIHRLKPSEIISSQRAKIQFEDKINHLRKTFSVTTTIYEAPHSDFSLSKSQLTNQLKVQSLDGFGLKEMKGAIIASASLLSYLSDQLRLNLDHIKSIKKIEQKDHLLIDHITKGHLELVDPIQPQNKKQTLYFHLNHTQTPMGSRLLKEWVQKPLINIEKIIERQDGIEELLNSPLSLNELKKNLSKVQDLERLMMKVSSNMAAAKDFIALKASINILPTLQSELKSLSSQIFIDISKEIYPLNELFEAIDHAIVEEPPVKLGDGHTFKKGYDESLDEWLGLSANSKEWIAKYQARLKEELDIKTLKVGYNRVFGYYIEVSKGQAHQMPEDFHRRQTLTNSERFISHELKDYETKVLQAQEKINQLEKELFEKLRLHILKFDQKINSQAKFIAQLDAILSLTLAAQKNHYSKPLVDEGDSIEIKEGRHPILEKIASFIPNDTHLDSNNEHLMLITGPNMAGKSTYIRQVALIVIMAQMGSFVPAGFAHIGVVEKIFSRIGASDNLAQNQSTFMVEMVETANILNNLSDKSLVILDEIGRGTSTYDGIAIASSTAEFILKSKAKTLFATHYSELTELEDKHPGVINYTVKVHEENQKITFLYKIGKGYADKSYGIHVAELAGLPKELILRAKKILSSLEKKAEKINNVKEKKEEQLSLFLDTKKDELIQKIQKINLNSLTPIEALNTLQSLQIEALDHD